MASIQCMGLWGKSVVVQGSRACACRSYEVKDHVIWFSHNLSQSGSWLRCFYCVHLPLADRRRAAVDRNVDV